MQLACFITHFTAIVCSNPSFVVTNSSAATPALLTIKFLVYCQQYLRAAALLKISSLLSAVDNTFAALMTLGSDDRSNGNHSRSSFGIDGFWERISLIACFARDSDLAPMYTLAPCNASCLTVSKPIPELIRPYKLIIRDLEEGLSTTHFPPVTSATLPARLGIEVSFHAMT